MNRMKVPQERSGEYGEQDENGIDLSLIRAARMHDAMHAGNPRLPTVVMRGTTETKTMTKRIHKATLSQSQGPGGGKRSRRYFHERVECAANL